MPTIRKLLIANRGEIAVRIIRTCQKLGIATVAIYSDADSTALHVREADSAYRVGPAPAAESYLSIPAILEAARSSGADSIHPGYGFLSEREVFAQAVVDERLIWVGPRPEAIRLLGDKISAKRLVEQAGVPTVPGFYDPERGGQDPHLLQEQAKRIGFPLLIKASAGGGGKGMRLVEETGAFAAALEGARREAAAAFGDDTVFLERYITRPRHIEFQIIGDEHGNIVHLGERECSIQRRHQKVLEESPSPAPAMTPEKRAEMGAAAVAAGRAANYSNAGTVEFIMDEAGNYYFLEMNTRLQVEHPVTEEVTRVPMQRGGNPRAVLDLVELQLRVAGGEELPFAQDEVQREGHAIEVRVYAEDPAKGFLPSVGKLDRFSPPNAGGVRNEVGVEDGDEVSVYYDPMLAKLIVVAPDRPTAIARLVAALSDYQISGVTTNISFLFWLAQQPEFAAGKTDTGFIDRLFSPELLNSAEPLPLATLAAATYELLAGPLDDENHTAPERTYNPWRDQRISIAGQGPLFSYQYQAPGAAMPAGVESELRVRFFRQGQQWRAQTGQVAATVRELPGWNFEIGIKPDGAAAETLFVVKSAYPDAILVRDQQRSYTFHRTPDLSTDTLQVAAQQSSEDNLKAPMPGKIIEVLVADGQAVSKGDRLVVMEAMKMEWTVRAPHDGHVLRLLVERGQLVQAGALLVEMQE